MVRYSILGPVELCDGERGVGVGGPRQVALLALLLVNAGRAISADRLIDALWSDLSRVGASKRLQVAITRLRRTLDRDGGQGEPVLRTVAGGYLLAVRPGELDAEVFEQRVQEGRRALQAGDPARGRDAFSEALGMWRGPALAQVAYEEFAQPEIRRLEELRLAALEARVDCELRLGEQGGVVGELEGLVAAHPGRERLAGQLMLAMYRCGRQGDALEVYARTRAYLSGELGLEPGPALQTLQGEILAQSPALQPLPAESGAAAGVDAPAQQAGVLPTGVVTFVLTDVESSTGLWDADPDAMAAALELLEELIAHGVEHHEGRLLKERGEGDATLSVFERASDAVACAAELQRAVAAAEWPSQLDLRLRIALHSGEAQERSGDYFGAVLNRAARLRSLAAGGVTVVSQSTAELVRDRLPQDLALVDVGRHELRGLSRPERVYELRATQGASDGAPGHFGAPVRLALPRSLQTPTGSPFVGRAARSARAAAGLLERECECGRLERAISAAVDGAGSVVAIEGEAGIGKTSLVAHATGCGSSAGMRVLTARGGELEREFAYGVVRQLFEVLLASATPEDRERWLAGAAGLSAPVLSSVPVGDGVGQEPSSVLHGLYWLSANLSVEQPLVIAVDDAQWADTASSRFLSYLAPRVGELAVVIVYASRVGEGASGALPAVTEPELVNTVLRPAVLTEPAVALLIEQLLDRPSSQQFTRACHVATGGNPFLLHELLRALEGDDVVPDDANVTRVDDIAPTTIALATLARLRRLGPAANDLACALAVLGRSAELRHAAALAQQDDAVAVQAADVLTAAGVVRDGRPLEFIHPIVRTTVYNALALAKRAGSHKRAARLLAQDGVVDVALAPHLLVTEPSGDRWVVERLRAAAHEVLERGAPDAACTYLERATREPAPPADRLALLLALGSAELQVGKPTALARLQVVLQGASDVHTRLAAAQELVWALVYAGRVQDAVKLSTEVVAGIPDEDEELALRMQADLVAVAQFAPMFAKPVIDGLARYEDRLRGKTSGERQVLACLAFRAAHRGETAPKTASLALLALANGDLLHDHYQSRSPAYFLAVLALLFTDWLDEAERYFDLAIDEARKRGFAADSGGAAGCRCHVLIRQGRLAQAEAEALSTLAANEPHAVARVTLLSCVLLTMTERSDARAAELFLTKHALDGDLSGVPMCDVLLFCRGQLRLACGDPAAALRDFQALHRLQTLSGLDTPAIPSRACQALAHLQLGDRDAARALAEEELQRARRWDTPSALGFALRTAGLVEGGARGIELLEESVARVEQSPAAYERACCLTELGAALRRAGQRRAALQRLREGLDLADRCGALRLAGRARDELVALGARPRRAALSGRDALTPSERRVAQLAADGLSNRDIAQALFVTLRTVEAHLTHTYMKLDINARQQLADAMATPDR